MEQCKICGTSGKLYRTHIGLLCNKHYCQVRKFGKIKRTKFDPNEFIQIDNSKSYIVLYDKDGNESGRGLIDNSFIETAKKYKWHLCKNGYIQNASLVYMHRMLLNNPNSYIDHINGNRSDNRLENLRICSNADNLKNRVSIPKNNTSGTIGVKYDKRRNKWVAAINVDKKRVYLGEYSNIQDAINARKLAESKFYKEFKTVVL